jgi:hemoglobin
VFYARARADALLGPVFEGAVGNWPHHLAALTSFWTAQLRGRGSYRGTPLAAHRPLLPALTPPMFKRWLVLWREATAALMSPADAATLQAKAADLAARMAPALFPQSDSPA